MSLLEDRILRIIELKRSGGSDASVAQELGIAESTVCSYEAGIKEMLQKYEGSLLKIVQASHFSFTAVNIVAKHYEIVLNDSFTPLIKKKEATLRVEINTELGIIEFLAVYKEKKKVNEVDLALALQKAQNERLPCLFISEGEINKKGQEYLEKWKNLIKYQKIKL